MLRIDLTRAEPGMSLALPVRDPTRADRILLKVGFELDRLMLDRLREVGVRSIWIQYPSLEALGKYVDESILASQGTLVREITGAFTDMQKRSTANLDYAQYCRTIGQLVRDLVANPTAAMFMGDLIESGEHGDELLRHASSVTYLSVLMGLKLEGYLVRQRKHIDPARAKEVSNLGLGAMLHDIGVTQLAPEVRAHRAATGDETDPAWREHTTLGYRMVRGKVEPSAATCVLNHHQRYDGSGYTGQGMPLLVGDRIHVFARIVGLADAFDRLRNPLGQPPRPTVWALRTLLDSSMRRQFDPQSLRALFAVTPPYPPGVMLRLSDGRHAVTINHHVADPCRPLVQPIPAPDDLAAHEPTGDEPIDLREPRHGLQIIECDGVDVAEFSFDPPALLRDCSSVRAWF